MPSFFKKLQGKKWDYLFLVTRKGYWSYKLLVHADNGLCLGKQNVYSDRFLMKASNRGFLKGKKVFLVDDTMTHGYSLFRYFCIMKKEEAEEIIPAVYALSTEFPRETIKERMVKIYYEVYGLHPSEKNAYAALKAREEFIKNLYCYRYLNQDNISKLCLAETKLFQKTLCPFVIDLPMLVSRKEDGKVLDDYFVMEKKKFEILRKGTEEWSYVPNASGINPEDEINPIENCVDSRMDTVIQCGYFEYHNIWTEKLEKTFLQNAIVKCKYDVDEEGNYRLIFIPFAIVRSCKKTELWDIFQVLLGDTDYGKMINAKKDGLTDYDWIGIFRSVIYVLSLYISEEFQKYLYNAGISDTGYDWEIILENSESVFCDSMKMLQKNIITQITALDTLHVLQSETVKEKPDVNGEYKDTFSLNDAYKNISQLVKAQNYSNIKTEDKYEIQIYQKGFLSIEDMEQWLFSNYFFSDAVQKRRGITSIIELMLETSVCGNYVYVTEDTIIRGFRHGENSDLLLSKEELLCHICVDVLYISLGRDEYIKHREAFLRNMQNILNEKGIFDEDISETVFERYLSMALSVAPEDVHYKVMGKRFLVRNLNDPKLKYVQKIAIDEAEKIEVEEPDEE